MPIPTHTLTILTTQPPTADAHSPWLSGALGAAGVAVICVVLLRRWFKLRHNRNAASNDPRDRVAQRRAATTTNPERDALESLMVEVQELTRTCVAQIENRAVKLEQLLALADERIAHFQQQLGDPHAAAAHTPTTTTPHHDQHHPLRLSHDHPNANERQIEDRPIDDPLLTRTLQLRDQGLSPIDIARQTGISTGKVELMLRLHPRASA